MYRMLASLILSFYLLACPANLAAAAKPVITADNTYYDTDTGLYLLKGNVRVEVAGRVITAGQAKVSLNVLEIWGFDGIALRQNDIYLTADSVYVYGKRNQALLNGHVKLLQPHITISADAADFNWRTKLGIFSGNVQVTQDGNTWSAASVTYNSKTGRLE